jgi:archaemetzincin
MMACAGSVLLGWTAPVLGEEPNPAPSALAKVEPLVVLQPLGTGLPTTEIDFVVTSMVALYSVRLSVLPPIALPKSAFYPARQRYRAEKLLDTLKAQIPAEATKIMGLTQVDISTTKGAHFDWGILGLAELGGPAAVISTFRCGRGAKSPEHARVRFGKVAVHEFGHNLGLDHCATFGCLLEDAGGTVTTLERETDLCATCRRRLSAAGHPAKDNPALPWG